MTTYSSAKSFKKQYNEQLPVEGAPVGSISYIDGDLYIWDGIEWGKIETVDPNAVVDPPVLIDPGGVLFTTVGTHSWTVPDGVTSISAVAIGGGGGGGIGGGGGGALAYNTYNVTPGEQMTVVVGAGGTGVGQTAKGSAELSTIPSAGGHSYITSISQGCFVFATGGAAPTILPNFPRTGDTPIFFKSTNTSSTTGRPAEYADAKLAGQIEHLGGNGGSYSPFRLFGTIANTNTNWRNGNVELSSCGGGAGGYTGAGGAGAPIDAAPEVGDLDGQDGQPAATSSGGAGGGGHSRYSLIFPYNGAGGGTGVYGRTLTGAGGQHFVQYVDSVVDPKANGDAGSGGTKGNSSAISGGPPSGIGGLYGGGAAGASSFELTWNGTNTHSQLGGQGAVRIIWGTNRQFPFTNTGDSALLPNGAIEDII